MAIPVTDPCQKLLTPIRFTPFWMQVIISAPSTAPMALPVPARQAGAADHYGRYGLQHQA